MYDKTIAAIIGITIIAAIALIENDHVVTTEHELGIDGHHLIEKKEKCLIDGNGTMLVFVHIRSIDEKSYKITLIQNGVFGSESQVESDMTEDEVKKFEEDWTNLWNPDIPPPKRRLRNFINNIIFISILILFLYRSICSISFSIEIRH
jgi:hypothetical protein